MNIKIGQNSPDGYALLISTSRYKDPALNRLAIQGSHFTDFRSALSHHDLGKVFRVNSIVDESNVSTIEKCNSFFNDLPGSTSSRIVLIYFSTLGILDPQGGLYLTTINTDPNTLAATAVQARLLNYMLNQYGSRRQAILMEIRLIKMVAKDEFGEGLSQKYYNAKVDFKSIFEGKNRIILTSTTLPQYFMNSANPNQIIPNLHVGTSLLTPILIKGLRGAADFDEDKKTSLLELYRLAKDEMSLSDSSTSPSVPEIYFSGLDEDIELGSRTGDRNADSRSRLSEQFETRSDDSYGPKSKEGSDLNQEIEKGLGSSLPEQLDNPAVTHDSNGPRKDFKKGENKHETGSGSTPSKQQNLGVQVRERWSTDVSEDVPEKPNDFNATPSQDAAHINSGKSASNSQPSGANAYSSPIQDRVLPETSQDHSSAHKEHLGDLKLNVKLGGAEVKSESVPVRRQPYRSPVLTPNRQGAKVEENNVVKVTTSTIVSKGDVVLPVSKSDEIALPTQSSKQEAPKVKIQTPSPLGYYDPSRDSVAYKSAVAAYKSNNDTKLSKEKKVNEPLPSSSIAETAAIPSITKTMSQDKSLSQSAVPTSPLGTQQQSQPESNDTINLPIDHALADGDKNSKKFDINISEAALEQIVDVVLKKLGYSIEHHKEVIGNSGIKKQFDLMATQIDTNKLIAVEFKKKTEVSKKQIAEFKNKAQDFPDIAEKIFIADDYEQDAADIAKAHRIQLWDRQKVSKMMESTEEKGPGAKQLEVMDQDNSHRNSDRHYSGYSEYGIKESTPAKAIRESSSKSIVLNRALRQNQTYAEISKLLLLNSHVCNVFDAVLTFKPYFKFKFSVPIMDGKFFKREVGRKIDLIIIDGSYLDLIKESEPEKDFFESHILSRLSHIPGIEGKDIPESYRLSRIPSEYLDSEQLRICAKAEKSQTAIEILNTPSELHFQVNKSDEYAVTAISSRVSEGAAWRKALEEITRSEKIQHDSVELINTEVLHVPFWEITFKTIGEKRYHRRSLAPSGSILYDELELCPLDEPSRFKRSIRLTYAICERCGKALCKEHIRKSGRSYYCMEH